MNYSFGMAEGIGGHTSEGGCVLTMDLPQDQLGSEASGRLLFLDLKIDVPNHPMAFLWTDLEMKSIPLWSRIETSLLIDHWDLSERRWRRRALSITGIFYCNLTSEKNSTLIMSFIYSVEGQKEKIREISFPFPFFLSIFYTLWWLKSTWITIKGSSESGFQKQPHCQDVYTTM